MLRRDGVYYIVEAERSMTGGGRAGGNCRTHPGGAGFSSHGPACGHGPAGPFAVGEAFGEGKCGDACSAQGHAARDHSNQERLRLAHKRDRAEEDSHFRLGQVSGYVAVKMSNLSQKSRENLGAPPKTAAAVLPVSASGLGLPRPYAAVAAGSGRHPALAGPSVLPGAWQQTFSTIITCLTN